ncbi:MAG: type II/IV secretion system protein [Hyphomonadaceae bacterium]|nr:type II/IV secretion system protein [Hyphomonadaceae bacterium]
MTDDVKTAEAALVETLVGAGALDAASARRAAQTASATGEALVAVLHQLALADDAVVADALARQFGLRMATRADAPAAPVASGAVSAAFLRQHRALPLGWSDERLVVGIVDPTRAQGLAAIAFAAGCAAEARIMAYSDWRGAFDALYGADEEDAVEHPPTAIWADDAARVRDQADAAPAVRLVDAILEAALESNASDIHIEPLPDRVRVRYRLDGELTTAREEPPHMAAPIAARVKILADMDVTDRRRPQDGRTSLAAKGRPVDVRISTVPSSYGETVALRLLRRDAALLDLRALGFSQPLLDLFTQVLALRRGLFLVTGPTGSGKTTTLYAMLERLRGAALKILSIEDPVEYFFSDITQVQVNEDAGLTFASALRSFLRQDPDIILVGEIRDTDTARIAVQAALTGHLVLATLHTIDAPGALTRLADMGVDRYLIGATLAGVVSQRLMRRLCDRCRKPRAAAPIERALLAECGLAGFEGPVHDPIGCPACRGAGYRGRTAVAEGFFANEPLRAVAHDPGAFATALAQAGFTPLLAAAAARVAQGEASIPDLKALSLA